MPLEMPQADTPRLKAMLDVAEENLRALEWFSGYLNLICFCCPMDARFRRPVILRNRFVRPSSPKMAGNG